MKANAKSLRFLGASPQKITVPFFQRRYVWEESNWQELYENIRDSNIKPFLGSIIIKHLNTINPSEAIIVDGQQRLTTLTLLSKAIFDSLPVNNNEGVRNSVQNFLFYRINASHTFDKSFVKISHSKADAPDYNKVICAGLLNSDILDPNTLIDSNSNILKCYIFFRDKLETLTDEEKMQLHDNLFNENREMIVLVELDENDVNEQSIFDSINRTGVRLNGADIIKNFLFQKLLDTCENQREYVYSIYDKYWGEYFYQNGDFDNLWDKERNFGNNQRTNLEFLLYCVAIIRWGWNDKVFSDLPSVYKLKTDEYTFDEFVDLVKEINNYAKIFYDKILEMQRRIPSEEPVLFSFKDFQSRFLLILEKFGVQMFYPYVLSELLKYENKLKEIHQGTFNHAERESRKALATECLRNNFNLLESFIIRNRIARKSVSDYATRCSTLIRNDISLIRNWISNDSDLKNEGISKLLNDVNNDTAKMILFIIELYLRSGQGEDINELQYKYSLEHILPKSWQTHWWNVPVINERGKKMSNAQGNPLRGFREADVKAYRDSYITSIGNMTLLTKNLNASIKNSDFKKKIDGDKKSGGYKKHTSLKITRLLVDAYNRGDKVWDERHIRIRKEMIMDLIYEIWPE